MKIISKFLIVMSLVSILSACGGNAVATQEDDLVSSAYTAAAMTVEAQVTSTLPATATPFPTALPTLYVVPTSLPVSPTMQSVTSSYTSYSTANGCNDASYVSDVTIPDGTVLAPGESFTKTWAFQNTGTCDWDEDYLIIFSSGTAMDGDTTEIDQEVLVGSTGSISVYLTAPSTEGTYVGYWRMADSDGTAFGEAVYVMIVVSDDAAIVTPTPTTEETTDATSTTAPTSTPEATSTYTPTSISTDTPIPTETEETGSE